MESEEPISDFVGIFFPENIGGPNRLRLSKGVKYDE